MTQHVAAGLQAWPVDGIGEILEGTDLGLLLSELGPPGGLLDGLLDGDVVLVTSKVVSKAEGRVRTGEREAAIREETRRVVARRGPTSIVENRLGLVMAAAGVDASNLTPGQVALLPLAPDSTAASLREQVARRAGKNVAVIITDTAGRAWRTGQTDLALGAAGILPLDDHTGRSDSYGNPLAVTAPAVVDELASLAELVTGKLGNRPVCVVRGLAARVLPLGEHGPGASALLRPRDQDMFALGAREAVLSAVQGRDPDCFGSPASPEELLEALESCGLTGVIEDRSIRTNLPDGVRDRILAVERIRLVAHAHRWLAPSSAVTPGHAEGRHLTLCPGDP